MDLLTALFGPVVLVVLCTLTFVAIARAFGVMIPFGFLLHIGERRERDLITSMRGRSRGICIFVSFVLLFTFPMFLALIAYDRLLHVQYSSNYYTGTGIVFVIFALCGVHTGNRIWKKAQLF